MRIFNEEVIRMAGHSKWNNIKQRKGAQDAKRGKIFQKLSKEPLLTFAIFRSESGCKDKTSFYNLQIFGELFSKNFFFAVFNPPFLFGWDCKDKARNKYKPNILIAFCQYVINSVINIVVNKLLTNMHAI